MVEKHSVITSLKFPGMGVLNYIYYNYINILLGNDNTIAQKLRGPRPRPNIRTSTDEAWKTGVNTNALSEPNLKKLVCKCSKKIFKSFCKFDITIDTLGKADIAKSSCSRGKSFQLKHVTLTPTNRSAMVYFSLLISKPVEKAPR